MGKHEPPKGRDPRPKGAQRGVVRRDNQGSRLNFGDGLRPRAGTARQAKAYARRAGKGK